MSDDGIGFDAEYAERIFRPFERLHDRAQYAGTGLGLALVNRVASRHGGDVSAESEPGRGSPFRVRLPAARDGEAGEEAKPREAEA